METVNLASDDRPPSNDDQEKTKNETGFLGELWKDIRPTALAMLGDAVVFQVGLLVLGVTSQSLRLLEHNGYRKEYVEILEKIHFTGFVAVLLVLSADLIFKLAAHGFGQKSKGCKK